ncbi:MAG: sigma-70 family RNA polymerase sigma factor [Verrucomicrobiales bacterium]|nr:sigma-70 family RNA polymerase sigma factor [Verrucomicrobiales bacterium]
MTASLGDRMDEAAAVMTDEQAMWRVQMHNDSQAFAEIVRRWETPLRRLGVRLLGDVHRAEDVVQEAFARVFSHRRDFEPGCRFSTWVWRITINLCHDELRRRQRRPESAWPAEDVEDVDAERSTAPEWVADRPGPDEAVEHLERAEAVRRAVLRLPEPYRVVVALRHYEGLRFHEVAAILDIPEGTVKSRVAEALDRLEVMLRPWNDRKT